MRESTRQPKRPAAGVVAAGAMLALLAACSSEDVAAPGEGGVSPAPVAGAPDRHLNILYWQAASTLNPYLSGGTKDVEAASLVLEPLARYDDNGDMVAWLVEEIPTVANGGVAADLRSVTWRLREDVVWADGTPFTAADVVFTGTYCMHEQMGCNALSRFADVEGVEAVSDHVVRIAFSVPKPFPYGPFVGATTPILQRAQFAECLGAKAQECTAANFGPVGTGPFKVDRFRANDVIAYSANERYRDAGKPWFRTVTLKGGGDAASAARAVLETGEYDYAWNLQVEPEVLERMSAGGTGEVLTAYGTLVERLMVNHTNDDPALGPERRSLYLDGANPHPFLSDPAVRRALSLAIDRPMLVEAGYGAGGRPTCNVVPAPARYASTSNDECLARRLDKANELLDAAGWARNADGVRAKDGVRLSILFQTSTNSVRQGAQALIKQMWRDIGVETELRNIDGAVFFGGDPASPDTFQKFYADIQMYTNNFDGTDPEAYLAGWACGQAPGPHNQWLGSNIPRGCVAEYDALVERLAGSAEPAGRETVVKRMNDILVQHQYMIPLVWRARLSARATSLRGMRINAWDSELWNIADWHR